MAYDASSIFCFFHCSTNCCCPSSLILGAQIECRLALSSTKNIFLLTPVPFLLLHNSVILLLLNYRLFLLPLKPPPQSPPPPNTTIFILFSPPTIKTRTSTTFLLFSVHRFHHHNSIVYPVPLPHSPPIFFSFDYSPVEY